MKPGVVIEVMIAEHYASVRLDPGVRRQLPLDVFATPTWIAADVRHVGETRRKRLREAGAGTDLAADSIA
jgi:hypothetical protein